MHDSRFNPHEYKRSPERNPGGRVIFGLGVATFGLLFFLKTVGILHYSMHVYWPVILVVMGLLIGMKSRFHNHAWWILIFIGAAHLVPEFYIMGKSSRQLVWPVLVILAGIMIALRPKRRSCYPGSRVNSHMTSDNQLYIDVAFGGKKEIVTSRDFRGGRVAVAFGGAEINLSQADIAGEAIVLDCKVAFGGIELVVPANWDIQNEVSPSFGAVEDERVIRNSSPGDVRKTLILRGSCTFGSIEIKSF